MAGRSRRKTYGLSGNQLKAIGIFSMVIDHTGAVLLSVLWNLDIISCKEIYEAVYFGFRLIGRLSFPIFAFLLTEGFFHTKSVKRYLWRLGLLSVLSEIPFDIAVFGKIYDFSVQNVFFTLFIGLLAMYYIKRWEKTPVLGAAAAIGGIFLSWIIKADYGGIGIILILVFYLFHGQKREQLISGAVAGICMIEEKWEIGYLAVFPFLYIYNGLQGTKKNYTGYWFYPVHLAVLAGIREIIIQAAGRL